MPEVERLFERGDVTETEERIVSGDLQEDDDESLDTALRPRRLASTSARTRSRTTSASHRGRAQRGEPLDHVLLYGPPGLGKTTLAYIIAAEMGVSIRVTSGPAIERAGDLAAILTNLQAGDVLFIDEIHRLLPRRRGVPLPGDGGLRDRHRHSARAPARAAIRLADQALHARRRDDALRDDVAAAARPLRRRLPPRLLRRRRARADHPPLRRRSSASPSTSEGVAEIARRARGTPRVANRLLRRVRDYAEVMADGAHHRRPSPREALARLEIDALGLDDVDHRVLRAIIEKFDGGPVGLETIAASISEEADTIMDVYEPYLMQLGFLQRTPRGRIATRLAYEHLGIELPPAALQPQQALFD